MSRPPSDIKIFFYASAPRPDKNLPSIRPLAYLAECISYLAFSSSYLAHKES